MLNAAMPGAAHPAAASPASSVVDTTHDLPTDEATGNPAAPVASQQLMATLLQLQHQLSTCETVEQAASLAADELRRFFDFQQVVIGFTSGLSHHCRLAAVSGVTRMDAKSELTQRLEGALDDAMAQDRPHVQHVEQGLAPVYQFASHAHGARTVLSGSFRASEGAAFGAWIILTSQELAEESTRSQQLATALAYLSPTFALVRKARGRLAISVGDTARQLLAGKTSRIWFALAAIAALSLLIPWPYTVSTSCELQPVTRRYVAAPFDVTLQEVAVAPGDVVKQGQILAKLDGREIRWELAGLQAELRQAEKQRDAAMASRKISETQIAQLELERTQLKIRILQERAKHLEIRSPVDGIIIGGDLQKVEGAPLETGQTMFEVAPLEQMIVEVAVPERDVAYVTRGMKLSLQLDAYPGVHHGSELRAIHPRAETRDGKSVFIAEALLENRDGVLRPGMKGRAHITTDLHPLGWNLFHKAWDSAALRLGW